MKAATFSTVAAFVVCVGTMACGTDDGGSLPSDDELPLVSPADRAVAVSTTGCGDANDGEGSGVVIETGQVATAAHVVAGSAEVTVADGGREQQAWIVAFDPKRDLALLEVAPAEGDAAIPRLKLREASAGEEGLIVGATRSGTMDFVIASKTRIEIEEVRGTARTRRSGYQLEAMTEPGDSGAGLYDDAGHLVGVLFAVSTNDHGRSWAVSANEVEAFLDDESVRGPVVCDPQQSKVVPSTR